MITFGQGPTPADRGLPTSRPAAASYYTPRIPTAMYNTHINPLWRIMNPIQTRSFFPTLPEVAQPGNLHPAAPAMQPMAGADQMPSPGRRNGGGGLNPYRMMRAGMFPSVAANASGLEQLARRTAAAVSKLTR